MDVGLRLNYANLLAKSNITNKVITGFNTDIEYNGVTYHVQTEDKGLDTPLILSLVYNRGTILASKRSPYNDLLIGNFNEKELTDRLQRQHKLICAAIRAGRIEDLKKMNSRDSKQANIRKSDMDEEQKSNNLSVDLKIKKIERIENQIELKPLAQLEIKVEETPIPTLLQKVETPFKFPIQKPDIELPTPKIEEAIQPDFNPIVEIFDAPIEITDADLIFDDTQDLDEIILPPEAVEILTDFSQSKENTTDQLFIELLNEVNFKGGENQTISIMVGRGKERLGLVGANIMIKVLGTSFRPLIFHTKTDSNGVAIVTLQIPHFARGRAAVLLKAVSNGEEAELRRAIHSN